MAGAERGADAFEIRALRGRQVGLRLRQQLFTAEIGVLRKRHTIQRVILHHDHCEQDHRRPDFDDPGFCYDGDLLWRKHPPWHAA